VETRRVFCCNGQVYLITVAWEGLRGEAKADHAVMMTSAVRRPRTRMMYIVYSLKSEM
jgi:hypothetical protein